MLLTLLFFKFYQPQKPWINEELIPPIIHGYINIQLQLSCYYKKQA